MRRRSSRHIDMLPLLDVFMVVMFVFATIQEDEHEAERAESEHLAAQLDASEQQQAEVTARLEVAEREAADAKAEFEHLAAQLDASEQQQAEVTARLEVAEREAADAKAEFEHLAAQLDASEQQQAEVTARLEAAEREAADAKEESDKLRAEVASVVKQFIFSDKDTLGVDDARQFSFAQVLTESTSNKATLGVDDARGVDEFLRREEVLDMLLNHFYVFEIEVVGEADADGGTVTNRCCYRAGASKTPWKSCKTVPHRAAELDAWLQDGGDGLVNALRATKGGNVMTVIRQDRTATHRVAHSLSASLRDIFHKHEIYSMIPEESPTLVSHLCGGI